MVDSTTINEDYESAVAALLSPVHQASTPAAIREASARRRNTVSDMTTYLNRIGLAGEGRAVGAAPPMVIHVTGTKGKGSTLSFCESILRNAHGLNTGLFTSPHLVTIRERIRINGVPLSKETFAKVYWKVRRKLESRVDGSEEQEEQDEGAALPKLPLLPGYFRMLTLMAFYTFHHHVKPKLDVILVEVGMGGRYDATNVFEPLASSYRLTRGVTVIDYDHTRVLGSTLEQIAWEKAGIYVSNKVGEIGLADGGYEGFVSSSRHEEGEATSCSDMLDTVFASSSNTREVLGVLERVANENRCHLETVDDRVTASSDLGIGGDHQRGNAALAMALCRHATRDAPSRVTEERVLDALSKTSWPGRCQTLSLDGSPSIRLRCDGAHTPVSMDACIDWFADVSGRGGGGADRRHRALVFNCSHERNPLPLLYSLHERVAFDSVYFCRADFERPSALPKRLEGGWLREPLARGRVAGREGKSAALADMMTGGPPAVLEAESWQGTLSNIWQVLDKHRSGGGGASTEPVAGLLVKDALDEIRKVQADSIEVLVTGSLYLVGSALVAADWEEGESVGDIHAV